MWRPHCETIFAFPHWLRVCILWQTCHGKTSLSIVSKWCVVVKVLKFRWHAVCFENKMKTNTLYLPDQSFRDWQYTLGSLCEVWCWRGFNITMDFRRRSGRAWFLGGVLDGYNSMKQIPENILRDSSLTHWPKFVDKVIDSLTTSDVYGKRFFQMASLIHQSGYMCETPNEDKIRKPGHPHKLVCWIHPGA